MSSIEGCYAGILMLVKQFDAAATVDPDALFEIVYKIVGMANLIGDPAASADIGIFVKELFTDEIPSYGFQNLRADSVPVQVRQILYSSFGIPEGQVLPFPAKA